MISEQSRQIAAWVKEAHPDLWERLKDFELVIDRLEREKADDHEFDTEYHDLQLELRRLTGACYKFDKVADLISAVFGVRRIYRLELGLYI